MADPWVPPHIPPDGAFGDDFAFLGAFLGPSWSHHRAMEIDPTKPRGGSVASDRWYYYRLQYIGRREETGDVLIKVNGQWVDITTLTPAQKESIGYVQFVRNSIGEVSARVNFYDPAAKKAQEDARDAADRAKEQDQARRFAQQRAFMNWVDVFAASYASLSTDLLFQRYEELRIQIALNPPALFDDTNQVYAAWQAVQKVVEKRRAEGEFAVGTDPITGVARLQPATAFNNFSLFASQQAAAKIAGGVVSTAKATAALQALFGPLREPEPSFIDIDILNAALIITGSYYPQTRPVPLPPVPGVPKSGQPGIRPVEEPGGNPTVAPPPRRAGFPDDFFAANPPDP